MNDIKAAVLTICIVLVGTELISRFAPKDKMVTFVRSLIVTILLISAVMSLRGIDLDLGISIDESGNEELNSYAQEQVDTAVKQQTGQYIEGLLQTIQIESKEILVFTDINDEGSILIEKVSVNVQYESDKDRALALLKNTVGSEFDVEVTANGS